MWFFLKKKLITEDGEVYFCGSMNHKYGNKKKWEYPQPLASIDPCFKLPVKVTQIASARQHTLMLTGKFVCS